MKERILGFAAHQNEAHPILGESAEYRTATGEEAPERQEREIKIVPVQFSPNFSFGGVSEHIHQIDQPEVQRALLSGIFVTTESGEDFSGQGESDFALLMSYAPNEYFQGRGGILLHKEGGEYKPVTLTLETEGGSRKFFLDLKGTGTPEGVLMIDADDRCVGGLREGAAQEYETLLEAEKQHPLFSEGIVPFAVYHGKDSRGYGQVARAVPTTMRSSFRENEAFDELRKLPPEEISIGLGRELGRYLAFDPPHLAANLQTENAYLVETPQGQKVIATDFMEIIPIHRRTDPFHDLFIALETIQQSVYEDKDALANALEGLVGGLKEVRPDLEVDANSQLASAGEIVDYLATTYLAKQIVEARSADGMAVDLDYLIQNFDFISRKTYEKFPGFEISISIERYLEQEKRLFAYLYQVSGESDPKIRETLEYILRAQEKVKEIPITEGLEPFKDLLPLPYYAKSEPPDLG